MAAANSTDACATPGGEAQGAPNAAVTYAVPNHGAAALQTPARAFAPWDGMASTARWAAAARTTTADGAKAGAKKASTWTDPTTMGETERDRLDS